MAAPGEVQHVDQDGSVARSRNRTDLNCVDGDRAADEILEREALEVQRLGGEGFVADRDELTPRLSVRRASGSTPAWRTTATQPQRARSHTTDAVVTARRLARMVSWWSIESTTQIRSAAVRSRLPYAVSDRILAAVMPGPHQPIEVREFPRPDLADGRGAAADRAIRSVRHRCPPVARSSCPVSRTRSSPATCRPALSRRFAGRLRGIDGEIAARRRSRRVLRRASHLRALSRVHGPPDADAVRRAPRLRHHRSGREGLVRRLVAGDLPRARRRRRAAA